MWRGDKQSGESQGLVPPCPRVSEAGGAAGDGWTDGQMDRFLSPAAGQAVPTAGAGMGTQQPRPCQTWGREGDAAACSGFAFHWGTEDARDLVRS